MACIVHTNDIQLTYMSRIHQFSGMKKVLKSYRFDENTIVLIEELKASLRLENNSAVLRRAITLLNVAATTVDSGGKVIIRDDDGEREVLL